MKTNYILGLIILFTSCGNQTELKNQIEQLQNQNDSLSNIIYDYQSKYVYENVFVKHYKTNSEPNRIGAVYKGEFVFVPDVRNDKIEFMAKSESTDRNDSKSDIIELETATGNFGAYPFEFKILSDTTRVYFKPIIRDSLSKSNQNVWFDGKTITDVIITN